MRASATRSRRVSEREVEKRVIATLVAYGCVVYRLSQGFRSERGGTRQTPGLADLWWFCPRYRAAGWFEVKALAGQREHERLAGAPHPAADKSPRAWRKVQGQVRFKQLCADTRTAYGIGGVDEARALMEQVKADHAAERRFAAPFDKRDEDQFPPALPDDLLEDL